MSSLESLTFDNGFARLPEAYYSRVCPTPVPDPYLVCYSPEALALLDLDDREITRPELIETLAGNQLLPGMDAIAALYAGHQFGQYVPQLGDGRAILLGEVKNAAGEGWEVQLKGAGRTPYSRGGDGRAVLRSSIREFLCSEAMFALGIPTTRALAIVGSDRPVYREEQETAALVTRLAPSFVRFGSFEVFYYRNQIEPIKQLADYVIARYYPELTKLSDPYPEFLRLVALRTAELMAQWQAVGFSHGVMNTDNMSILGPHPRLWPVRFPRRVRPRLRLQPFRHRRPLRLRPAARCGGVEPHQAGAGAGAADVGGSRVTGDQRVSAGIWPRLSRAHGRQVRPAAGQRGRQARDGRAAVAGAEPRRLHDLPAPPVRFRQPP